MCQVGRIELCLVNLCLCTIWWIHFWTWLSLSFQELPLGEWFCCTDCIRMRSALEEYLHHRAELLPSSNINIIKRKCDSRGLDKNLDTDIRWRLLSGRALEADSKLLLSRAVTIFHVSDVVTLLKILTNVSYIQFLSHCFVACKLFDSINLNTVFGWV